MQAQITSANPTNAPTSGRVSNVTPITTTAAIPTITTHLKTAASLSLIALDSSPKYGRARKPSRSVDAGSEVREAHF